MKDKIIEQLKNLLPIEKFKEPYHRDYDSIWTNAIAEDLQKNLPKDHTLAEVDGKLFVTKKATELEGYEKFKYEAQTIHAGDNKIPFADFMDRTVRGSEGIWKILLKP